MKTRILIAGFSFCICFGSLFAASQTSSFQFLQKPGPYSVGLKVVDQYDPTRAYPASSKHLSKSSVDDDARPLQTLIWYPSVRSTAESMTVGDYVELADTEIHFNAPDEKENRWRSLLKNVFRYSAVGRCEMRSRQKGIFRSLSMLPAILPFRGRTPISASISPVMDTSVLAARRWAFRHAT